MQGSHALGAGRFRLRKASHAAPNTLTPPLRRRGVVSLIRPATSSDAASLRTDAAELGGDASRDEPKI